VAGNIRVPRPATGMTALVTFFINSIFRGGGTPPTYFIIFW
jgi:hypothetical protein